MTLSDCLTPEQEAAFKQVQGILDQHFDQWTLGVERDLDKQESLTFWTHRLGGKNSSTSRAIRLLASQLQDEQKERSSKGEEDKKPSQIGFIL